MIKPHTNDIRMTHEYIRVKYYIHTSDIRVYMSGIKMIHEYIER